MSHMKVILINKLRISMHFYTSMNVVEEIEICLLLNAFVIY